MPENNNNKMALACALVSIAGLLIMLFSNYAAGAARAEIGSITKELAGERLVLCGTVKSIRDSGKDAVFLDLRSENASIDAVFFRDVKEKISGLETGSDICVEGNVQVYNGDLELVGRKLVDYPRK